MLVALQLVRHKDLPVRFITWTSKIHNLNNRVIAALHLGFSSFLDRLVVMSDYDRVFFREYFNRRQSSEFNRALLGGVSTAIDRFSSSKSAGARDGVLARRSSFRLFFVRLVMPPGEFEGERVLLRWQVCELQLTVPFFTSTWICVYRQYNWLMRS